MEKQIVYELLEKLGKISDDLIELQVKTHDLHQEFYNHLFEKNTTEVKKNVPKNHAK